MAKNNVKVIEASPVTRVATEKQTDGTELVRVSCRGHDTPLSARSVILATGAWTASVNITRGSDKGGEQAVKIPKVKPIMYMELFFKVIVTSQ